MDNPDLVACAIIGDGEAETGPTATYRFPFSSARKSTDEQPFRAWHAYKYIDPKESGGWYCFCSKNLDSFNKI